MIGFPSNLTYIQVDALRECIDFLHNGYVDRKCWFGGDKWILYLDHIHNQNKLKITVRQWSYVIEKNSKVVKTVEGLEDRIRYHVQLDSEISLRVAKAALDASKKYISSSVSPITDVE